MPRVPRWFEKELRLLDPRYFVVYNDDYNYYEIKMKMDYSRKVEIPGSFTSDGVHRTRSPEMQIKLRMHNPTVATFDFLNDAAMLELRRRRYEFLKRSAGQDDEMKEVIKRNKESKAKREEIGQQMMVDGFMEDYKYKRRRSFVMPAPA